MDSLLLAEEAFSVGGNRVCGREEIAVGKLATERLKFFSVSLIRLRPIRVVQLLRQAMAGQPSEAVALPTHGWCEVNANRSTINKYNKYNKGDNVNISNK